MSRRTRWRVRSYGPAVLFAGAAVPAYTHGDALVGGLFVMLAVIVAGAVVTVVHAYRAAYWRGRVEQLQDISAGRWPDPNKIDPHPSDRPPALDARW